MSAREAIWDTPLHILVLMMREKIFQKNPDGITLQDKEAIDEWQTIR